MVFLNYILNQQQQVYIEVETTLSYVFIKLQLFWQGKESQMGYELMFSNYCKKCVENPSKFAFEVMY